MGHVQKNNLEIQHELSKIPLNVLEQKISFHQAIAISELPKWISMLLYLRRGLYRDTSDSLFNNLDNFINRQIHSTGYALY